MDPLEPFRDERNRQFTGDEVFFYDHLCRASAPGAQRCRSHQHEERRDLVAACQVDPGPGGCRGFCTPKR